MSSTGDAVDGIGISKTACGNEIEYMTDRKAFSKLLAAYEQGKLDWTTYTDPNIRGKHCSYAGAIAKDRESYVTNEPTHSCGCVGLVSQAQRSLRERQRDRDRAAAV